MTLTQYKERWEELIVVTIHAVVLHVFDDGMFPNLRDVNYSIYLLMPWQRPPVQPPWVP